MNLVVLRFYGRYSYGLYLYHYLLRNVLKKDLYLRLTSRIANPTIAGLVYLVCCLLLLTAVSVASFHLYELPFLKLKARFTETSGANLAKAFSRLH